MSEAERSRDVDAAERQYATFVHWTERLVDRRAEANRFYVGVNTLIFAAAGYLLFSNEARDGLRSELVMLGFPFAGLILSYIWGRIIRSQRSILKHKFVVIHELEDKLPSQPYKREWQESARQKIGIGSYEQQLPTLFTLLHLLLLIYLVHAWITPLLAWAHSVLKSAGVG